jgi:hypothetical protein
MNDPSTSAVMYHLLAIMFAKSSRKPSGFFTSSAGFDLNKSMRCLLLVDLI